MTDSILAHNSGTRILPDIGLVIKYQQQYLFHFRLFPRKLITVFKKSNKNHFGPFLAKSVQKWIFLEKKGLCQFLNIPVSYHRTTNQKIKLMSHSWEKRRAHERTDRHWQTDRETDRQTDRYTDRQRQFYMTLRRTGAPKVNCLLVMSLQRWDNWTWSIKMAHKDFFNKKCLQVKTDVFRTQESIYDGVFLWI